MENLIEFFEKKLNKKISLQEYNIDDLSSSTLKDSQNIVLINNKKYIIEITDSHTLSNLSGHFYLIHQEDLDFDILSNILSNLYDNIKIIKYNNYLVVNTPIEIDINEDTLQILETETYKNTFIVYLDKINDIDVFKFRIYVFENMLQFVSYGYEVNKFVKLQDLLVHNLVNGINKEKTFLNFVDNDKIESIDDSLLHTGLAFVDNDLNISKTSTSMFLHRNTLIYRLDKIKELLNLDLKNFKDAQIFYLSVKAYQLSKFKCV